MDFPDLVSQTLTSRSGYTFDHAGDRGESATVGTEGHRLIVFLVAGESQQLLAGLCVPHLYRIPTPAIASQRPSGLNCTPVTLSDELSVSTSPGELSFQTLTSPFDSIDLPAAAARRSPSGLKVTVHTRGICSS